MKKIFFIVLGAICSLALNGQTDSLNQNSNTIDSLNTIDIYVSEIYFKKEIDSLKESFQIKLDEKFNTSRKTVIRVESRLLQKLKAQEARIKELEATLELNRTEISKTSSDLESTNEELTYVKQDTDGKISNLDNSVSSKAVLSYILIFFSIIIAFALYLVLKKKLASDTSKLDGQISSTRVALEEEHMKLDQKLIEMLNTQMNIQKQERTVNPKENKEVDHSLALKVSDEIVRMQKNISNMPEGTKGLKQLSKAIQRIQDTFKINGYEMLDMLGKPFNEGMKVVANFVPNEDLESGQQIITRIIKPQVNYEGVMIQSAQIEVSVGE
jgi:hypothetical protein